MNNLETDFRIWIKENNQIKDSTLNTYTHQLKILGRFLNELDNNNIYNNNFFTYSNYPLFKKIYKNILGEDETSISNILNGNVTYYQSQAKQIFERFVAYEKKHHSNFYRSQPYSFGAALRNYLKFLYYYENNHSINNSLFNSKDLFIDQDLPHPVMFYDFYVVSNNYEDNIFSDSNILNKYKFINGLKFVDDLRFIEEDEKIKTKRNLELHGGIKGYSDIILNLINNNFKGKIILTSIPSSKVEKINVVSKVVEYICEHDKRFINGENLIRKTSDTITSHKSSNSKSRDWEVHYESWTSTLLTDEYYDYPILVIDDVITTGSTFIAAYKHLESLNFSKENIFFFAYGSTIQFNNFKKIQDKKMSDFLPNNKRKIDAIIFNLEQTLFDLTEIHYYKNKYKRSTAIDIIKNQKLYLYEGIDEFLCTLSNEFPNIKVAYIADRGYLSNLFMDYFKSKLPYNKDNNYILVNPDKSQDYKANSTIIDNAISQLNLDKEKNRIIGIGNKLYDIVAYKNANIESMLVNWGNSQYLENNFGADFTVNSVKDFKTIILKNI